MRHILLSCLLFAATHAATAGILPTPLHDTPCEGHFTLGRATVVSYDAELAPLADYLHTYLGLTADSTCTQDDALVLRLDAGYAPDAYALRILPTRIEIIGSDYSGVFNGIQTLFQLLPPEVYAKHSPLPVTLDCREITDTPRFAYRGMMLDVARTWIGEEDIKRYIDLLSYHKINKLHLHLADDEGWRIEIKSHPELTEIGGFRGGDSPVRPVYGKWDEKYGGFFTQEQMRGIIAYAAARNIEIIPEIDLPGHSRNIAHVHPEILCNYTPDTSASNGYDERSAWCVAREENYALLADILGELCELFPSPYIHIGGDEVEVSQWKRCPDCCTLMRSAGITDAHLLQDRFMERLTDILQEHGKRPAVWNEASHSGTLTRDSRVHGWQSVKSCLEATAKGYPTVVMPASHFYFDMRQAPREEGHSWAAIFDAKVTYEFDLEKSGFSDEQRRHIVGLQGAFWSEIYVSHEPEKPDYLDNLCFPRICVLAEQAWHGNEKGWDLFYRDLQEHHYDRMAAMGIRFRLFPPTVNYKDGKLSATTIDQEAKIVYTIDSDTTEHHYLRPLTTTEPHRYLFRTRYKTGRSAEVGASVYYRTMTPTLTLTTSMGESERIRYTNVNTYKTFARTARACRQGDWILYTFAEPVRCREIYLQTGHRQLPKTIVTTGYVEISTDGQRFERVAELEQGSATLHPTAPLRAVRIVSTCDDNGCGYVTIQPPQIKPVL